jgi:hypothetical protein
MTSTRGIVVVMLVLALVGCNSAQSPVTPAPVPQAVPPPAPAPASTTVHVNGYIADTAFRAVGGARVEVLDGPQAGGFSTTDAAGSFQLEGTFDDATRFRATKDGYVAATGTLTPRCATCSGNRFMFFYLAVDAPPVTLAGDYTLTFTADQACATLPAGVRTRTYRATVAPWPLGNAPVNTVLKASISGASFVDGYDAFPIGVSGQEVAFELRGEGPYLVERIGTDTYLGYDGWAALSVGTSPVSTISTSFAGVISYCVRRSDLGSYYDCNAAQAITHDRCESKNHRLTLTRR